MSRKNPFIFANESGDGYRLRRRKCEAIKYPPIGSAAPSSVRVVFMRCVNVLPVAGSVQTSKTTLMVRAQKRIKLGFLISRRKVELPIHMKTLYVEPPQKTTLLLPPSSTGFYPDGNYPG
jgi:hypothetical protein